MFGQVSIVTLPSGDKVRAKKPSLITMFAIGLFPSELTAYAMMLYNRELTQVRASVALPEPSMSQSQIFKLMDTFLPHVLVDPQIGDETTITLDKDGIQTGTVKIGDIGDDEKNYLFLWGQGLMKDDGLEVLTNAIATDKPADPAAVATFPATSGADAGPAGAAVQSATVEPVGDGAVEPVGA